MEWIHVVRRYYPGFLKIHLRFGLSYFRINPFRISRMFLQNEGAEDIYTYGETPLTVLHEIADECGISKNDTVFELGCGRGLGMFWLNHYIGCKVVGVEKIPLFVRLGMQLIKKLNMKDVSFRNENMLNTDYSGATVLYFYGTGFEDSFIERLTKKIQNLPKDTKIITVSYPMSSPAFQLSKQFDVKFNWGTSTIYLQKL